MKVSTIFKNSAPSPEIEIEDLNAYLTKIYHEAPLNIDTKNHNGQRKCNINSVMYK